MLLYSYYFQIHEKMSNHIISYYKGWLAENKKKICVMCEPQEKEYITCQNNIMKPLVTLHWFSPSGHYYKGN